MNEASDKTDTNRLPVEAVSVSADFVESSSLVNQAVGADQEVVTDVMKAAGFDVEGLYVSDQKDILSLGFPHLRSGVACIKEIRLVYW